jgi:GxxExxY protein
MGSVNHGEHGGHGGHGENQQKDCSDELITSVLDAGFLVHRGLGPGLLESVYEEAMGVELAYQGVRFERQVPIPAMCRGKALGVGFRADIVVENVLLLELKAVEAFSPLHLAQTMTYLKLMSMKRGLLLNFNCKLLKDGIKRVSV